MDRYVRQVLLSQIGEEGQRALHDSSVAIIGCGALGSSIAEHLTRAGVGTILVVDRDFIELSNLQRQHLFTEMDVGEPKAETAETKLKAINSDISITGIVDDITSRNVEHYIQDRTLVLDGTDNLDVRFLLNDACNKNKIPWIFGACVAVHGMSMNIQPEGPCLRCLFPQIPPRDSIPTCDTVGIMNTLPTIVSSIQSTEAIKYLVSGQLDSGLLVVDVWERDVRTIDVSQRKNCPCCVDHIYESLDVRAPSATILCGRDAVQVRPPFEMSLSLDSLAESLSSRGFVKRTPHILFFTRDTQTFSIFSDGRAIIKGTNDVKEAQSLYEEYVEKYAKEK
ncbi:MAG: ThiF family adenylyltransferase [Theionarchaea archaeon]|nr:ThiF family adenylyltransferase [Theionarchaea archaeon]MBU7036532.1 ThiF family adenylyltransferase [Theionarchaea archaeon]